MSDFALLHSRLLDSSVWELDNETRLVWITLLAMKDREGVVQAAPVGLARRARVTLEGCNRALKLFHERDPDSSNPENEGRRIEDVPGGWRILNADWYRFGTEGRREFWRQQKARQREKARLKKGQPLPGEVTALRQAEAGDQAGAEAIAAEPVPRVHGFSGLESPDLPPQPPAPPGPAEVEGPSEPEAEDAPVEED